MTTSSRPTTRTVRLRRILAGTALAGSVAAACATTGIIAGSDYAAGHAPARHLATHNMHLDTHKMHLDTHKMHLLAPPRHSLAGHKYQFGRS